MRIDYECHGMLPIENCESANKFVMNLRSRSYFVSCISAPLQAVGSEGETLPDHVGIPLGEEHGGATYFMLETHYDNPARHQNVVDHSGLRIFYTDQLREEPQKHTSLHDVPTFT